MKRPALRQIHRLLAPLAVMQMTLPATASAQVMMVPICGDPGHFRPIRLPGKNDGPSGAPCCKICHISMRKRIGGDSCCDHDEPGDDTDTPGPDANGFDSDWNNAG